MGIIRVDVAKCKGCGACSVVCPKANYDIVDEKGKIVSRFVEKECLNCGECIMNCESSAIIVQHGEQVEIVDEKKCIACEKCILVCPHKNFEIVESNGQVVARVKNKGRCERDGRCEFVCKYNAIVFRK